VKVLDHRECGGEIVEQELKKPATVQLRCLKCGKVWSVPSDLSDIDEIGIRKHKLTRFSFFFKIQTFHTNPIIDFVFNERLGHIVRMVDFSLDRQIVGVDLGCWHGYFTQYLARHLYGMMIGVDVDRCNLRRAKFRAHLRALRYDPTSYASLEFVQADVSHLPFKKSSVDLVLAVSVLEHLSDLEGTTRGIKDSLRINGELIAGYPIETRLFLALIKLFLPIGRSVRDPKILGKEQFEKSPDTHKQSFTVIRSVLRKNFQIAKREKSFLTVLPDQMSWYESVKMKKVKQRFSDE
jgi:SAM-dependent methyltransferase